MRRAALLALFAGLILASGAGFAPAEAALSVCNKSSLPAKVAIGRFNGTKWISEGWWTVAPAKCETLVEGALNARYYYLYATDGAAGTWDGSKIFCTSPTQKFAIVGRGACAAVGYDRRGFFEIDTGKSVNWTQALQ
jgi:uncharacterized membrane protein